MEEEKNNLIPKTNPEKNDDEIEPSIIGSVNEEDEVNELVPPVEEPEEPEPVAEVSDEPSEVTSSVKTKKMPSWLRNFLIVLVAVVVIFAAGFIVSQITYSNPARNQLAQVSLEKNQLQENLSAVRGELELTKNDLDVTRKALTTNQSDFKSAESEIENLLSSTLYNQNLFELKYNVALARIALLNADKLSARQALSLAQDNFEIISPYLDQDNLDAVEQRLSDSYKLIISNIESSLEELRTLSENLERVPVQ